MKYCFNCNRVTIGDPLFCNFCGKTYNIKLCPRLHVNPRSADVCSQCGSRDLSAPQPKVPFWGRVLVVLITFVLWVVILSLTVLLVVVFLRQVFSSTDILADLIGIGIILALMWWIWMQIPLWIRKTMFRLIKGKDKDRKR